MSSHVEVVTYSSDEQAIRSAESVSVTHTSISTVDGFKSYFFNLSTSVFVLLLFFNPPNQILHAILEETRRKQNQIIGVLICGNSDDNLINNSMNICFVSKQLLTYKIKSNIVRFLDMEQMRQFNFGNIELGKALYQERTDMVDQFHMNDKLKGCHILLIPLNATSRELHIAEQRLKNICHDLYGNEYKFIIRTLFDFIPENECNPDDQSYTAYLQKRYKGDICHTIMKLSFIRMYVVGNETYISNQWSQKLVAAELDINQEHDLKYVDRCSFIMNQPVDNQVPQDLVPIFGGAWQIQSAFAKSLDVVRNDFHFQCNLLSIHGCLENREIFVNSELYQRSLINSDGITKPSSKIQSIEQAQNSPEEKQNVDDIESKIL